MRIGRYAIACSIVLGLVIVLRTVPASGQTPVPTGRCCCDAHGHVVPCSGRPSNSSANSSTNSGPSAADIEAERGREAERRRLEDIQQRMEQERLQREAEQKRAQEEFLTAVRKAASELKGVSHDEMGLKGVGGNDAFFGLKGVSREEGEAQINNSRPDSSPRDVSTASKQLTCAADITNYALKHVSNVVTGIGNNADMDEIKYLAGEAINALQGNPVGVQCNSSGAVRFAKAPDLKAITPLYKSGLDKMVKDSQTLYMTHQRVAAAQQKVADAKKRVDDLKPQGAVRSSQAPDDAKSSPKSASSSGDPAVDKAYAEQKAWQEKDQKNIDQIYEEQKKLQQQQFDALALLRKAQAELKRYQFREDRRNQSRNRRRKADRYAAIG